MSAEYNVKGVMLSSRPFGGRASSLAKPPFISGGTIHHASGMPLTDTERSRRQKNKKLVRSKVDPTNNAFTRHRKLLKELQSAKKQATDQQQTQERQQMRRSRSFINKSEAQRANIMSTPKPDDSDQPPTQPPQPEPETVSNKAADSSSSTSKPVWARTATENARAEHHEVDELCSFAQNLDFDDWQAAFADGEVRQALQSVQKRVQELQHRDKMRNQHDESEYEWVQEEVTDDDNDENDENDEGDVGEAGSRLGFKRVKKSKRVPLADSGPVPESSPVEKDEAAEMADRVLHTSHSIRSVHSHASVKHIVRDLSHVNFHAKKYTLPQPRIVVHPEEGEKRTLMERRRRGLETGTMAYLYRHPAM